MYVSFECWKYGTLSPLSPFVEAGTAAGGCFSPIVEAGRPTPAPPADASLTSLSPFVEAGRLTPAHTTSAAVVVESSLTEVEAGRPNPAPIAAAVVFASVLL